jgi:molybdate transport system regulatory protein
MKPRLKVWVVFGDRVKFGDGRARLLALVDETGSLRQAVARFGMSYRNAWGYLRDLEKAAGFKLLERQPGGPARGTRLTPEGKEFLAHYRRFRLRVDRAAARLFEMEFQRSGRPRSPSSG